MAGTLTTSYLEAFRRADVEPVVHVQIQLTSPSSLNVNFHNGHNGLNTTVTGGDPILKSINAVNQKLDPVKRKTSYGTVEIEVLDDGYIRSLASTHNFYDAITSIRVGTTTLANSDFATIYTGVVDCVWGEPGSIFFKIKEFPTKLSNYTSLRTMHNKHPLEVMYQILQDVGVSTSYIEASTFAFDAFSDISHLCFSSYAHRKYQGPDFEASNLPGLYGDELSINSDDYAFQPGAPLATYGVSCALKLLPDKFINEFCMLTSSVMVSGSNGKIKMVKSDHTAAVNKHITVDEYSDFEQENKPLVYNLVRVEMGSGPESKELVLKDAASIAKYGERNLKVDAAYLVPVAEIPSATAESWTSTVIKIPGLEVGGFAGTRNMHPDVGQVAADKVSADRPAFYMYRREVLKTETAIVDLGAAYGGYYIPIWDTGGFTPSYPDRSVTMIQAEGVTRAFGGAQPDTEDYHALLIDVSPVYPFCAEILRRYSNSAPEIKFSLGLEHCDFELGDTFSIDNEWFVCPDLGLNGLDSNTKFEVVKRDVVPLGDTVEVKITGVYLNTNSPPSTTISIITPPRAKDGQLANSGVYLGRTKAAMNNSVTSGFTASTPSGLNVSISDGSCTTGNSAITNQETTTFAVQANKDTYIGIDSTTGIFCSSMVSTGAVEPALYPNEIRLAKIVAGSSVTSIVDLRNFGAISTKQIDRLAVEAGRDLIFNSGFGIYPNNGAAPDSWDVTTSTPGTDFYKDSATVYAGRHSVKTAGTSQVVRLVSDKIPIDKTRVYRASAFYQQAASFNMKLFVFWWKADQTASSTSSVAVFNANLSSTGAWQNITGVVEPPSDAAYASLDLNSANTGVSYFNNASLELEAFSFSVARASSDFTSSTSGDPIVFNSELHDFGSNYNTTDGKFTVPKSGTYTFACNISFTGTSGARDVEVRIVGSTSGILAQADLNNQVNGTAAANDVTVSLNIAAAALVQGETVEVDLIWGVAAPVIKHSFSFWSGREIL